MPSIQCKVHIASIINLEKDFKRCQLRGPLVSLDDWNTYDLFVIFCVLCIGIQMWCMSWEMCLRILQDLFAWCYFTVHAVFSFWRQWHHLLHFYILLLLLCWYVWFKLKKKKVIIAAQAYFWLLIIEPFLLPKAVFQHTG